jgi:hypothetical protein
MSDMAKCHQFLFYSLPPFLKLQGILKTDGQVRPFLKLKGILKTDGQVRPFLKLRLKAEETFFFNRDE